MPEQFTPEQQKIIDAANARIGGGQSAPAPSFTPEQQQILDAASQRAAVAVPTTPVEPAPDTPFVDRLMPMGPVQYRTELQKLSDKKGLREKFENPLLEGSQQGFLGEFADEASAAFNAPFHAAYDWFKGGDFDVGRAYTALQQQGDAQSRRSLEEHPVAAITGRVLGGVGGSALAAKPILAAGKLLPTVVKTGAQRVAVAAPKAVQYTKAVAGGAGYGALSGAGAAKPGERLQGAKEGAVVGALTGGVAQAVGNKIVKAVTNRAAKKATQATSGDLATAGRAFYDAAEAEGVRYAPHAVQRLGVNVRAAAGRLNENLRPKTVGIVEDAMDKFSGNRSVSFEEFAEFRQELNAALKGASPNDRRTLMQVKGAIESWGNQVQGKSADFTGDAVKAFNFQKQADQLWARAEKTKVYEDIWDDIQRKGPGVFTQGGIANAAKNAMESHYKVMRKNNFRGYSKEEVELVRQMASGGSASKMIRLLSKFDPKGAVSILSGVMLDPTGILTGTGYVAGRARERAMESGMQRLLTGAATGGLPADVVAQPARNLVPAAIGLTSGVNAATTEPYQSLKEKLGLR